MGDGEGSSLDRRGPQDAPGTTLFPPFGFGGDGANLPLLDRVSACFDRRQEQDLLLNVKGEIQEVHDLRHPRPRDVAQPRQVGVVAHLALRQQPLETNGQRHEPGDPGHTPKRDGGRSGGTLAEQGFLAEFGKLVSHLVERLSGSADGEKKIFRDSAVTQLGEFFSRFRELNIGSSAKLEELVALAQRAVRGVDPQELRDNGGLRQHIAGKLSAVQGQLDRLMVDRPRRRILRPVSSPPPHEAVA